MNYLEDFGDFERYFEDEIDFDIDKNDQVDRNLLMSFNDFENT